MRTSNIGAVLIAMIASPLASQSLASDKFERPFSDPNSTPSVGVPPSAPLTLEEAQRLAISFNPLLRGARSEADATMGAFIQAGVRPNPDVSLMQEGFANAERTTTAQISQRFELGGQRGHRLDAASYAREGALAGMDARAAALQADVADAFYSVLSAQKQVELQQDSFDIATRSAELAQRKATAGKVSPVEATKARVAATGAQIGLASAKAQVFGAQEKLASTIGVVDLRGRTLSGNVEVLPDSVTFAALQQRIETSPAARRAFAAIGRSNALVSLERARRMPDITISAGMKRIMTSGVPRNQAMVGISIPLPIFDTNQGSIIEAAHRADKADADWEAETARLRSDLAQAYSNYQASSLAAHGLKQDVLPAARETLDAMSRGFDLGKFGFLDVLDAQRTLFQARAQYLNALTDAHTAYSDMVRLVGGDLVSSSSTISE